MALSIVNNCYLLVVLKSQYGMKIMNKIIEIRSFQVNIQSPSEAVGLQAGDVILAVNGMDLSGLKHKEAQEKIVKSGNNFQMTILRLFDVQGLKIRHRTLT